MKRTTPLWRGATGLLEQPGSPEINFTRRGTDCRREFRGPYAQVLANTPARGDYMLGLPNTLLVDSVNIKRAAGDIGVLTIVAASPDWNGKVATPLWSKKNTDLSKSLWAHPKFAEMLDDVDTVEAIHAWENEKNFRLKKLYGYYLTEGDGPYYLQPGLAVEFAKRLAAGRDAYGTGAVLVEHESFHNREPASGKIYVLEAPARWASCANKWIRTQDDVTQEAIGRWVSRVQWTGADDIDEYLYT
jgi:hypothetical protein